MPTLITSLWRHLCRNSGQCSICQGWFPDWNGGVCAACIATGRT